MEELWKPLAPPFDKWCVSNFGRIKNGKGSFIKPFAHNSNGSVYPFVHIIIRRKDCYARLMLSLNRAVYERFGENYQQGITIYHKDGDKFNCRIDNLYISKGYTEKATEEQINIYTNTVIKCVKHIVGIKKLNCYYWLDVDNIMGEAYLLIWKHLSQYKVGTSFYMFCKRYVDWVTIAQWKKDKKRLYELSYETLSNTI